MRAGFNFLRCDRSSTEPKALHNSKSIQAPLCVLLDTIGFNDGNEAVFAYAWKGYRTYSDGDDNRNGNGCKEKLMGVASIVASSDGTRYFCSIGTL